MNSVTVYFINNGGSQTFSSPTIALVGDQFWLNVLDENNLQVAMIPREQIQYVVTPLNTAP